MKVVQEKGICLHYILRGEIIEGLWPSRKWGAVSFKVVERVSAESGRLGLSSLDEGSRSQEGLVDVQLKNILTSMQHSNVYFILPTAGWQGLQ